MHFEAEGNSLQEQERKNAGKIVSTLLERQQELSFMDPFLLLKEVTEQFKVDPDSERYRRYQEYSQPSGDKTGQSSGAAFIKNKEMFLQA